MQPRRRRKSSGGAYMTPRSTESMLRTPQERSSEIHRRQGLNPLKLREEGGKHGSIAFFAVSGVNDELSEFEHIAIKKQPIKSPRNIHDRAYRETFILQQLSSLKHRREYFPGKVSTFIDMPLWFKDNDQSMNMNNILEKADGTLHDVSRAPISEVRSLFFQTLFALYVAQTEFEFMHNDLHAKNILFIHPNSRGEEQKRVSFRFRERIWVTEGRLIKLADFGLSRMRVGNKIVYNRKNPSFKVFLPGADIAAAADAFNHISIEADSWCTESELLKMQVNENCSEQEARAKLTKQKKKLWMEIRKKARSHEPAETLLFHPFFEELIQSPYRSPLSAQHHQSPIVLTKPKLVKRFSEVMGESPDFNEERNSTTPSFADEDHLFRKPLPKIQKSNSFSLPQADHDSEEEMVDVETFVNVGHSPLEKHVRANQQIEHFSTLRESEVAEHLPTGRGRSRRAKKQTLTKTLLNTSPDTVESFESDNYRIEPEVDKKPSQINTKRSRTRRLEIAKSENLEHSENRVEEPPKRQLVELRAQPLRKAKQEEETSNRPRRAKVNYAATEKLLNDQEGRLPARPERAAKPKSIVRNNESIKGSHTVPDGTRAEAGRAAKARAKSTISQHYQPDGPSKPLTRTKSSASIAKPNATGQDKNSSKLKRRDTNQSKTEESERESLRAQTSKQPVRRSTRLRV